MPRYILFAKFKPEELARRTSAGFADQEAQAHAIWASVGGQVESWYHGAAADEWDVIATVDVPAVALFAVANSMVSSGVLERSSFMQIRTSTEADAAIAAVPSLRLPA